MVHPSEDLAIRFEAITQEHLDKLLENYSLTYACNSSDIQLPTRSTSGSSGYDFLALNSATINPGELASIHTGVKAKFPKDCSLLLMNRSSLGSSGIILANGVGLVDSDYYSCISNDGEISFRYFNIGSEPYEVAAGDKVGQGLFVKHLLVWGDTAPTDTRVGGYGSTGVRDNAYKYPLAHGEVSS